MFAFYLDRLADVHRFSPQILEILFCEPGIETLYVTIAGFLWEPTNDVSIIETALATGHPLHDLATAVSALGIHLISHNFGMLFDGDISDPHLYATLLSLLLSRLSVFFEALEKLGPEEMLDFLGLIPLFLSSTAPSVVSDAAVYTVGMIGRHDRLAEFAGVLFEPCLRLISTPFESFAGAALDEYWEGVTVRRSLFTLVQTIADCSDRESFAKELVGMILQCTTETCEFVSFVRVLSSILAAPLNIAAEARELTIFLLSSLVAFSLKTQNYCCSLLKKLLEFLSFEKQELDEFFQELFTMFTTQKPAAFNPFTSYFIQVVNHFATDIQFPASALEQIELTDSCFFVVSTLITMLTGVEPSLDRAAIELQWLTTQFEFEDPASMLRLKHGVSRSLEFLANVQSSDGPQTAEMINLLVQSNNVVIDISNRVDLPEIFCSIIRNLASAILTFAGLDSAHFASVLTEMRPPEWMSGCADIWFKRLAIPLLVALHAVDQIAVANYVTVICSHFLPIVTDLIEEPDSTLDAVAKRVAAHLCRLCVAISPDDAAKVLETCLRFDNFRVFAAAVEGGFAIGVPMVARLWPQLVVRKDQPSVDIMLGGLFNCWQTAEEDFGQFLELPGVSPELLEAVEVSVRNAKTSRKKKSHFRALLTPALNFS
jgi:hypothetical protein